MDEPTGSSARSSTGSRSSSTARRTRCPATSRTCDPGDPHGIRPAQRLDDAHRPGRRSWPITGARPRLNRRILTTTSSTTPSTTTAPGRPGGRPRARSGPPQRGTSPRSSAASHSATAPGAYRNLIDGRCGRNARTSRAARIRMVTRSVSAISTWPRTRRGGAPRTARRTNGVWPTRLGARLARRPAHPARSPPGSTTDGGRPARRGGGDPQRGRSQIRAEVEVEHARQPLRPVQALFGRIADVHSCEARLTTSERRCARREFPRPMVEFRPCLRSPLTRFREFAEAGPRCAGCPSPLRAAEMPTPAEEIWRYSRIERVRPRRVHPGVCSTEVELPVGAEGSASTTNPNCSPANRPTCLPSSTGRS